MYVPQVNWFLRAVARSSSSSASESSSRAGGRLRHCRHDDDGDHGHAAAHGRHRAVEVANGRGGGGRSRVCDQVEVAASEGEQPHSKHRPSVSRSRSRSSSGRGGRREPALSVVPIAQFERQLAALVQGRWFVQSECVRAVRTPRPSKRLTSSSRWARNMCAHRKSRTIATTTGLQSASAIVSACSSTSIAARLSDSPIAWASAMWPITTASRSAREWESSIAVSACSIDWPGG